MEAMGYMGFTFGLIAFVWCTALRERVKKLERIIQANGLKDFQAISLRQVLEKQLGKEVILSIYGDALPVSGKPCLVVDVDEAWLLVKENPGKEKEAEKLIRLDLIKNVAVK